MIIWKVAKQLSFIPAVLVLLGSGVWAQPNLTLSSSTALPGGSVSLNLTLSSSASNPPGALQWTFTYPAAAVSNLSVTAGAALVSAGKSVTCSGDASGYICIAYGMNATTIGDGVVATVAVTLSGSSAAPIGLTNPMAASAAGSGIAITGTGGTVSISAPTVSLSSLSCLPATLAPGGTSTCTVNVSGSTGATISLASNSGNLSVPTSVTVPSGSMSATFVATATQFTTNGAAVITGTLNGSPTTFNLNLNVPPVTLSGISCTPATVGPGGASTCTVTVSGSTGATVSLASNSGSLPVPSSVTVSSGSTSVTFVATATQFTTSGAAVITGTLNGNPAIFNLNLNAPSVTLSGISCTPATVAPGGATTCTVTVSGSTGATIGLASTSGSLPVRGSVTVPSGSTSATFAATATQFTTSGTAVITGTLNGSPATFSVNLTTTNVPASVICIPTTIPTGGSSLCTVTLTQPSVGWTAVSLSSNNSNLIVPKGVIVGNGATSTTFTATAGIGFTTSQIVTLTATNTASGTGNISSATASIHLAGSAGAPTLSCNPASLGPNASVTCTVAAPGATVVALQSSTPALQVPASVTVSGSTATFTATTTTISSDQTATLTATAGGVAGTTAVNLVAPALVSSLTCNPTSVSANGSMTCTVTLTKSASAGGATIAISTVNSLLTAPAQVTIGAGLSSGAFTLSSGAVSATQTGSVTANYNGSSASSSIQLVPSTTVLISSLICSPAGLMSSSTSSCSVKLSQTVATATTVTISSNSSLVTTPPSVQVPAGSTSGTFSAVVGTVTADATAAITATLGPSTQSATLTLWSTPALISLTCPITKISLGTSVACTVNISKAAGNIPVTLTSTNAALSMPAAVIVPQGAKSAVLTVSQQSSASGWIVVSGAYNGVSKGVVFVASGTTGTTAFPTTTNLQDITCTPHSLTPGSAGLCSIRFNPSRSGGSTPVMLTASNNTVKLPATVVARPSQATLEFQVDAADAPSDQIVIAAQVGGETVTDTIAVVSDSALRLHAPGDRFVKYGSELQFSISASDPAAQISTAALPAGATFDSNAGEFRWIPDATQIGAQVVKFTATGLAGNQAAKSVVIQVDSGEPVATRVVNAASRSSKVACGPGAIAAVQGRWFLNTQAVSDFSGASQELGGAKVLVNGVAAQLLSASETELTFLCPQALPGTTLEITAQTDHGIAAPITTAALAAAPGLFSIDGSGAGQGSAVLEDGSTLAMVRNYRLSAQPATAGSRIKLYATGLDMLQAIRVQVGETQVTPDGIVDVANRPGMAEVSLMLPEGMTHTGSIAVLLSGNTPDGSVVHTNMVTIAIESNNR